MSEKKHILPNDHYDTALVGVWCGSNYGSLLNGYAVYRSLKKMDLSVLLVHKHSFFGKDDPEVDNTHNTRFIKKYYKADEITPVMTFDDLKILNDYCDTFIAGSDQIWNYGINKNFNMGFMLNFVSDDNRKISFGTSFGHNTDFTPPELFPESKRLLQRFDAISVREAFSADVCNRIYNVKADLVSEPVFCLDKKEYEEIAEGSDIEIPDSPYILTYILDPTPEKRAAIQYYSEQSGLDALNIIDGAPHLYKKNTRALDLPNIKSGIAADDFLKLYSNARFIITDSFHGTAFAIIFNKPFISIKNYYRGPVRFDELLGGTGLSHRLVHDPEDITCDISFMDDIDYSSINNIIDKGRRDSLEWLKKAVSCKKGCDISYPQTPVTVRLKESMCTGCSACINICPKNALSLKQDSLGYYRATLDTEKCIDCGKCSKICPALELPQKNNSKYPECHAFIAEDEKLLIKSSSGGLFSVLAEKILDQGGIVYGAGWDNDNRTVHMPVSSYEDLDKLRKSKYMQSFLGDIFKDVQEKLEEGKKVLFSGCPCQIAGLKNYLQKDYDDLLMIDLLCGNSPSSGFFKKYLDDNFPEGISSYEFRHKNEDLDPGWRADSVKITFPDGTSEVRTGIINDDYQRVYHNHTMCAPFCEKCRYQEAPRFGDITIGDFWGFKKRRPDVDVTKGISVALLNNDKGIAAFKEISPEKTGFSEQVPLEWLGGNGYAINGSHNYCSPNRNLFYKEIRRSTFSEAVNTALKPDHKLRKKLTGNINFSLHPAIGRFRFDPGIWYEFLHEGSYYLTVPDGKAPLGKYASIYISDTLRKGHSYTCRLRFKLKTSSPVVNFHIKDSGSRHFQIIYSYKPVDDDWKELSFVFTPNSDVYDEFMIGASQISGEDNYIAFDHIMFI